MTPFSLHEIRHWADEGTMTPDLRAGIKALLAERDTQYDDLVELRTHIAKVLDGFDHRIFVRDVSRDHESGWGVRGLPYLLALSHLAEFASIGAYRCSGAPYHVADCGGTCGEETP